VAFQKKDKQQQQRMNGLFMLAPFALLYFCQAMRKQEDTNECEGLDMADRMRGLYENKIRFFCAPEKIFEIFASTRDE
jgi:hypothetical protein